jgi:4,5-DOPA dioxygenase extradiol
MNAVEENAYTRTWEDLGRRLPKPKAIVVISAHWVTRGTAVTAVERPKTIHDFYGFPASLHEMQYPAPGSPALAERIKEIVNIDVQPDHSRGLDHGAWSFLVHMYPEADIPVVQLSIDVTLSAEEMVVLGRELHALRDEVLIIGAGNIVHNLRMMGGAAQPWAVEFEQFVKKTLQETPLEIINYKHHSVAKLAADEHFLPLLYVVGASGGERPEFFNGGIELGAISMLCVLFGK